MKLDELAEREYRNETDNDPIVHCNRFPSWGELSKAQKAPYISRAKATLRARSADNG